MNPMMIVVFLKLPQFSFKIAGCPIEDVIQQFSTDGSNQPFNERMGHGDVRDGFQLGDFKDPQVGAPLSELKQRIVIAAQPERQGTLAGNDLVEHPADSRPVDIAGVHSESNDASRELVHDDHDPVSLKEQGFATEEVDRP
jgi:hypothetical protein